MEDLDVFGTKIIKAFIGGRQYFGWLVLMQSSACNSFTKYWGSLMKKKTCFFFLTE